MNGAWKSPLRGAAVAVSVLFCATPAQAAPQDAAFWLRRVADAAYQQNYVGTYIYQHGSHVETFRVAHLLDERGEHEKIEVLDDTPREIVRNNDEVLCFEGDASAVVVEKRKFRKVFPALLPKQVNTLLENYQVRIGEAGRVSGMACQYLILEPKDNFRYRHKLCADNASGLLLKASTLNERNEVMAQTAFTQLTIGGRIEREQLKPKLSGRKVVIHTGKNVVTDAQQYDTTWSVASLPPGFARTLAVKRTLPGKEHPVNQLVFSDGLATVSVFIEPLTAASKPAQGLSSHGVIHVHATVIDDHQVTVLGEVPAATVSQIASAVQYRGGAK
jgi:sigma-E factor negative regulatory protein RseB